jgi:Ca2+-binding RTX toxin-like protein
VVESAGGGVDLVEASVSYTLSGAVDNLTLTGGGAINGTGNNLANILIGTAAANVLDGGGGADRMSGGAGDDTYVVDDVKDIVTEVANSGADTVQASISFTLGANVETLTLTGSGAIDATGNSANNTLNGNSGANVMDGYRGADTMAGGAGDDTYIVDNLGDVVTEAANAGVDTVQSSISFTLGGGVENLTLTSSLAIEATGNNLANVITAVGGGNVIDGRGGADTMIGGSGSDTYVVDDADDVVTELALGGTDTVQSNRNYTLGANVEKLTLTGSGDIDGTGNDVVNELTGNSGANVLDGKLGSDELTGGADADSFVFSTQLKSTNVDTIADFIVADDTILLDDAVFSGLTEGALAAGTLVIGSSAADANDRIIYNSSTGALSFDADGSGSGRAVLFARLDAGLLLTADDFTVI